MFPACRCNYYWCPIGRTSPVCVAAFPGLPSATGRVPFGRPISSSRTLTTGLWTKGLGQTALCGEEARSFLPVPGDPSGRRRRIYSCSDCFIQIVPFSLSTRPRTWPGVSCWTRLSWTGTLTPYPADT